MFELSARKRVVNGVGFPYEKIFTFDDINYCYTALDTLDRNIYQEAMITKDNSCVMYVEFEKPHVKRMIKEK